MTKSPPGYDLAREVASKAERLASSRRRPTDVWSALMRVVGLGWVFVLPLVLGAAAGHFLASSLQRPWVALVGLGLGLVIGAYGVFRQVQLGLGLAEDRDEPDDRRDS